MAIKYEFPCYPGDSVYLIVEVCGKPLYVCEDKVQMIGFTSRSIQIKLREHKDFNKTYTWGKQVFKTKDEADIQLAKRKENQDGVDE